MKVCDVDIFPLYACTNKPPRGFNQDMNSYTTNGRQLIHDSLNSISDLIKHLLRTAKGQSVEYNDNRISLLTGQNGKCAITQKPLTASTMHCHHIKRKTDGGTDEYKNLSWILNDAHILIHATTEETIKEYLIKLQLTVKELIKVNTFRKLAGNFEIY